MTTLRRAGYTFAPLIVLSAFAEDDVQCNSGETAVGGGAVGTTVGTRNFPNLDIDTDIRADGPIDANGSAAAPGTAATGWHVSAQS